MHSIHNLNKILFLFIFGSVFCLFVCLFFLFFCIGIIGITRSVRFIWVSLAIRSTTATDLYDEDSIKTNEAFNHARNIRKKGNT